MHGGTTSVVMLLFSGTTSWFCWVCVCCWLWGAVPPGVMRIVLTACGVEPPLELPDDEPPEPPPEELEDCCDWHGCTATVCASAPFGTTIRLEPGGMVTVEVALPTPPLGWPPGCWLEPWRGHGGTMTVMSLRCFASRTVRTPGVWRAVDTGSLAPVDEELLLLLELLPQAASAATAALMATTLIPLDKTGMRNPSTSLSDRSS